MKTKTLYILKNYYILLFAGVTTVVLVGLLVTHGKIQATRPHETGLTVSELVAPQKNKLPQNNLTEATPLTATPVNSSAGACDSNGNQKLLLISISKQRLWACDGTSLVNQSAVTTGAYALTNVDNATPVGTWHIYSKTTNTTLKGCDVNGCWNDPVAYWMPYDDQVGFHDASWQTFPFGGAQYATEGSHGCVHLPTDVAAWVYNWAPLGTTVTVQT